MERVTGIEPVTKAWEAAVIPFHHTRALDRVVGKIILAVKGGLRPTANRGAGSIDYSIIIPPTWSDVKT